MPRLKIQHPIRAFDNPLSFNPGTLLPEETLDTVINSQRAYSCQTHPLLSYGSVKEDFLNFLSTSPYEIIFSDQKQINDLFNLLETVHLSIPVLKSLDYFRQHDFCTYAHILMVFALSILLAEDLIPDDQECIQLFATGNNTDIIWGKSNDEKSDDQNF